jgi:hypothetical protein
MKATREQVLAMARKAGFLKREIELQRASIDYLVELAQQFALDQLRANAKTYNDCDTTYFELPETLE